MKNSYNLRWEQKENALRVPIRVQTSETHAYNSTAIVSEEIVTYDGDFFIDIDVEAISRMLAGRAAHSKNGKSAFLHGMVKAKRMTKKEICRLRKTYPLPEYCTQLVK